MFAVVLMVSAAGLQSGHAADVDFPSANAVVSPNALVTYLDLARHFVPDIQPSDNGYVGTKRIAIRHIAGKDFDNSGLETFGFYDISTVTMQFEGKQRLAVLFDFAQAAQTAQGVAVLALYDMQGEPKLLDAVDVGFDQSTYFFDQALMPVAEGSDVILTMSTHFNSSQTYTTHSMIMVRDDQLTLVDTAFLFNERLCAYERQQNIRYSANPGAAKPYAPITVTVTESLAPTGDACGDDSPVDPAGNEIKVTYRWDPVNLRYGRDSDALEALASANRERF